MNVINIFIIERKNGFTKYNICDNTRSCSCSLEGDNLEDFLYTVLIAIDKGNLVLTTPAQIKITNNIDKPQKIDVVNQELIERFKKYNILF